MFRLTARTRFALALPPLAGDIGEEEQEEIELEPLPEHAPVHEPSPAVPVREPVPA